MSKLTFTACKKLDFESLQKGYVKRIINTEKGKKVYWKHLTRREDTEVQFCTLRGPIGSPEGCLCSRSALCDEYRESEHEVKIMK